MVFSNCRTICASERLSGCRRQGRFGIDSRDIRLEWHNLPELPLLMLIDQVFATDPTPGSMSVLLLSPAIDDQIWERVWTRIADKDKKKDWDLLRRDFREAARQRKAGLPSAQDA